MAVNKQEVNLFPSVQSLGEGKVQEKMNKYFSQDFLEAIKEKYGDNYPLEIGRNELAKTIEKHAYKTGNRLMVRFVKDCVRLTDAIDNGNLDDEIDKAEKLSDNLEARLLALKKLKEDNPEPTLVQTSAEETNTDPEKAEVDGKKKDKKKAK